MAIKDQVLKIIVTAQDKASAAFAAIKRELDNIGVSTDVVGPKTDAFGAKVDELGKKFLKWGTYIYLFQKTKEAITNIFETGADFEIFEAQITSAMGSIEKGKDATAWITDFETKVPADIKGVTEAFLSLKNFGIDPMNGSLASVAAATQQVGFTQEKFIGITRALGQAWSKEKLLAEESMQMIERGIPVWQLLENVTGKSSAELQNLARDGKLGQDVIAALIDEMGRFGAGAKDMSNGTAILSNFQSEWFKFLDSLSKGGLMDVFKDTLKDVTSSLKELRESGQLKEFAANMGAQVREAIALLKDFGIVINTFILKPLGFINDLFSVFDPKPVEAVAKASNDAAVAAEKTTEAYAEQKRVLVDLGDTAKEAKEAEAELEKTTLAKKKQIWSEEVRVREQIIDALLDKAKNAADQQADYEKQLADRQKQQAQAGVKQITAFDGGNDSPAVQLNDLIANASRGRGAVQGALSEGDTAKAIEAAKKVEAEYQSVAEAAQNAFDQGLIDQNSLDVALGEARRASDELNSLLQQGAEEQAAIREQAIADAEAEKAALEEKKAQLQELNDLATDKDIAINVDTTSLDAALAKLQQLQALPSSVDAAATPGFATGVRLPGYGGGDRIPALLEAGEGVLHKDAMRKLDHAFGSQFFNGLLRGYNPLDLIQFRRYANGGLVSSMSTTPSTTPASIQQGQPMTFVINGQSVGPVYGQPSQGAVIAKALSEQATKYGRL
ncbi:tail tape measure protein [Caudoviricetes sp.]|nr:tail tape measure protein [Caudoviricetes sp.]